MYARKNVTLRVRVWIETKTLLGVGNHDAVTLRVRVWIETFLKKLKDPAARSPSA